MSKLTPATFDALTRDARLQVRTHARATTIIWTAKAIGDRIGRSAAYVRRTLSQLPGTPVHRHGNGNFYADERELMEFMRKAA